MALSGVGVGIPLQSGCQLQALGLIGLDQAGVLGSTLGGVAAGIAVQSGRRRGAPLAMQGDTEALTL